MVENVSKITLSQHCVPSDGEFVSRLGRAHWSCSQMSVQLTIFLRTTNLCLWAGEPHDLVCRNIKDLAGIDSQG